MQITHRDLDEQSRGPIVLVPETLDDLWHLKYVVEPGDSVTAFTQRRVEGPQDVARDTGGERESMEVTVEVEDVEFHRFSNRLRIAGVIRACDREDEVGDHHTINVEPRTELTVTKRWAADQLDRLADAEASDGSDVVVATVEEGEAHVHTVEEHGVEEVATVRASTGKGDDAAPREELFGELGAVLSRQDHDALIVAGPGFTKRDAVDSFEEDHPALAEDATVVDTASVGGRGVQEVLQRGAVEDVAEEARVARETALVEELMERVATDGAAFYGQEPVDRAVEMGAVETLLVVDEHLREHRETLEGLLERVEQQGGEVTVLSSEFEPGQRIRELGGVAALLRFRIE